MRTTPKTVVRISEICRITPKTVVRIAHFWHLVIPKSVVLYRYLHIPVLFEEWWHQIGLPSSEGRVDQIHNQMVNAVTR